VLAAADRTASAVPVAQSTRTVFFSIIRGRPVAYIICEPCIGTKDTACVDVCPVDCIHPRKDEADFETAEMLYIHPDECIDCGACVPACPVEAIFTLDETPAKWQDFIGRNAAYFNEG
jgi:ferredoxin